MNLPLANLVGLLLGGARPDLDGLGWPRHEQAAAPLVQDGDVILQRTGPRAVDNHILSVKRDPSNTHEQRRVVVHLLQKVGGAPRLV